MKKIRVFETFAGIGSQHKALENLYRKNILEYKINYTSEWYTNAIFGYSAIHNLHKDPKYLKHYNEDIEVINNFVKDNNFSLDSKKISNTLLKKEEKFLRKLYACCKVSNNLIDISKVNGKELSKKIDLLTYSFPCQDLSIAGKGLGIKRDSNTRSSLLWQIFRILIELKENSNPPKILLMENVTTITSKKHRADLEIFKEELLKIGYSSFEFIENANQHNIPQNRKRFFMISIFEKKDDYVFNIKKRVNNKILSDFIKIEELEETSRSDQYLKKIKAVIKKSKVNEPLKTKFQNLGVYPTFNQANYVHGINSKEISTITFSGENSRQRVLYYENGEYFVKRLSGFSNLKLMGFTKIDYKKMIDFDVKNEQIRGLAGNSIVVNVLEDIFIEIANYLNYLEGVK